MRPQIQLSSNGKIIAIPYDPGIASVFPAERITYNGHDLLVTEYDRKIYEFFTALGCDLDSPFQLHYRWPREFEPFEAQRFTANMLSLNDRAYVLNGMGTGKTAATSAALDWSIAINESNKALIVAPLSTLTLVWTRELFTICPHRRVAVLHGSASKRKEWLAREDIDVYVINHDGLYIIADELLRRPDIDLIVIDELGEYRNKRTRKWKALKSVVQLPYRKCWGLTGTPTPNEPTDAWAQVKLITPDNAPAYFGRFKQRVMQQISPTKWIAKDDALQQVHEIMQPSVRFRREDCVDLPPVNYSSRMVSMSPKALRMYNDMRKEFMTQAQQGLITAANEGVKLGKLLQISCGFVYSDSKQVVEVDPGPRLNLVVDLISESDAKVLVFVPFVHALIAIAKHITQAGYTVAKIWGDTPTAKRNEIINQFQTTDRPHVLVAHPKTMAHGLNLTIASTAIWYSPTTSPNQMEQADNRMPRPGQTKNMHIIKLVGTEVERYVYHRLKTKQSMQGVLLSMFEKQGD